MPENVFTKTTDVDLDEKNDVRRLGIVHELVKLESIRKRILLE